MAAKTMKTMAKLIECGLRGEEGRGRKGGEKSTKSSSSDVMVWLQESVIIVSTLEQSSQLGASVREAAMMGMVMMVMMVVMVMTIMVMKVMMVGMMLDMVLVEVQV